MTSIPTTTTLKSLLHILRNFFDSEQRLYREARRKHVSKFARHLRMHSGRLHENKVIVEAYALTYDKFVTMAGPGKGLDWRTRLFNAADNLLAKNYTWTLAPMGIDKLSEMCLERLVHGLFWEGFTRTPTFAPAEYLQEYVFEKHPDLVHEYMEGFEQHVVEKYNVELWGVWSTISALYEDPIERERLIKDWLDQQKTEKYRAQISVALPQDISASLQ